MPYDAYPLDKYPCYVQKRPNCKPSLVYGADRCDRYHHFIISEYPEMALSLAALDELNLKYLYPHEEASIITITNIETAGQEVLDAIQEKISNHLGVIIYDERKEDAPLRCREGSVQMHTNYYGDYFEAAINYRKNTPIDDELAYTVLRDKLLFVARGAFRKSFITHNKKETYAASAMNISHAVSLAEALLLGNISYDDFSRKSTVSSWRSKALKWVVLPDDAYSKKMLDLKAKIERFEDAVKVWNGVVALSGCSNKRKASGRFDISLADLGDAEGATEKVSAFAERISVEPFIEGMLAGVPVEDLIA